VPIFHYASLANCTNRLAMSSICFFANEK